MILAHVGLTSKHQTSQLKLFDAFDAFEFHHIYILGKVRQMNMLVGVCQ